MPEPTSPERNISTDKSTTRRDLLKTGAALLATAIVGKKLWELTSPQGEAIPEPAITPELISNKPIAFGFNTHLYAEKGEATNLTFERYKKDVDFMITNDMHQIRLNIWPWESTPSGTPSEIKWNEANMTIYDQAINYAIDTNKMNMTLVTSVPEYGAGYSNEDYLTLTKTYYTDLATRYKGKGLTYQIFNEPDLHRFRDYQQINGISDEYIAEFQKVIAQAHDSIKSVDPDAKVTVNINKWRDAGVSLVDKGTRMLDAIKDRIDVITLDLYPFDNETQIADLPKFVAYFKDRYKKPIVIGELGMPSEGYDGFSISDQGRWVPKAIEALRNGPVKPDAVLIYEITDWANAGNTSEQNYGYFEPDGSPKASLKPLLEAIKTEPQT